MLPNASQWRPATGSAGLLGPRLSAHPQAYHTSFAPSHLSPPMPTQPSWDQANLIAAMNGLSTQAPGHWIFDSGAMAHMIATDGNLLSYHPYPLHLLSP